MVDQCMHFVSNILIPYFLPFRDFKRRSECSTALVLLLAPSIKFIMFVSLCLLDYLHLLDCDFLEDSELSHSLCHKDTHIEPGLFHTYQLTPTTWVFQPVGEYFNFKITVLGLHFSENV